MTIFEKARRLEGSLARSVTRAAKHLTRPPEAREPIELSHAIVDAVEREIQSGWRGSRVFPFNTIEVSIAAATDHLQARLDAIVNGDLPLQSRIADRLRSAGCGVDGLEVRVTYVTRAPKHWTDPQFAIVFSRSARRRRAAPRTEAPPAAGQHPDQREAAPRLELTVVHGVTEHPGYAFTCRRIDLGRGGDVRDSSGLIRTNHVAFAETAADVNRTVSRQHAHITFDPAAGCFRLHDDGSAYGTRIIRSGKTLPVPFGARGVRLQPGDDIVLGEGRLHVVRLPA